MPNLEILALDPAVPQIRAPGAGDGYSVPRDMTMASGTTFSAQTITANTLSASSAVFTDGSKNLTSSGTINLATQASGTLALGNGGTGATSQQGAINSLAGAVTSGQYLRGNGTNVLMSAIQVADVPTLNQNTTGTASNVTGTVAIANGGTGQTTANAALNALLPSQSTQSGKYLKTDGTNASWDQLDISTADITGTLLTSNGGTGLSTYTAGDTVYYASGTSLTKLAIGAANRVMTSSGSAPQWVTSLTGLTGVSSSSITNTSLTSGRVVYSTTGGQQTDNSGLTFDGTTLTATQIGGGAF